MTLVINIPESRPSYEYEFVSRAQNISEAKIEGVETVKIGPTPKKGPGSEK
jgi:hypothetical protein